MTYYCVIHKRVATHTHNGKPCCDPSLGGITMPCQIFVPLEELKALEAVNAGLRAGLEAAEADLPRLRVAMGAFRP